MLVISGASSPKSGDGRGWSVYDYSHEWCRQSSCMLARRGGFSGLSHASFVCDILTPPGRLIETNLMFLKARLVVVGAPGVWTPVFGTAPALLVGGAMVGLQAPKM